MEAAERGRGFQLSSAKSRLSPSCRVLRGQNINWHRASPSPVGCSWHSADDTWLTVSIHRAVLPRTAAHSFSGAACPRLAGRNSAAFEHSSTRAPLEDCGPFCCGAGLWHRRLIHDSATLSDWNRPWTPSRLVSRSSAILLWEGSPSSSPVQRRGFADGSVPDAGRLPISHAGRAKHRWGEIRHALNAQPARS
jgi:hypothetical protein